MKHTDETDEQLNIKADVFQLNLCAFQALKRPASHVGWSVSVFFVFLKGDFFFTDDMSWFHLIPFLNIWMFSSSILCKHASCPSSTL